MNEITPAPVRDVPTLYRISFYGRFDATWADWFDHMTLGVHYDHGASITTLSGIVRDQAALHGLLARIRDLGLILMYVQRFPEPDAFAAQFAPQTHR